jgi:hypothetical protein
MNRLVEAFWQVGPALAFLIGLLKWIDAYRLSSDIELPVPLPVRLVLARYNLLAVTTHIYRAFLALKKPASES